MKEVAISEFKAKCLALLEQVQKTKKPIRVTRFGKPVAEVVPPSPDAPADWLGSMKDTIEIVGDIVSPANQEVTGRCCGIEAATRHPYLALEFAGSEAARKTGSARIEEFGE